MTAPTAWMAALLLVVSALGFAPVAEPSNDSCQSLVPPAMQREINARYPLWRVVERSDLSADDAKLWVARHGETCPGVVLGRFDGSPHDQYGVLLIRVKPRQAVTLLYVVRQDTGRYHFTRLLQGPTALIPVISKGEPGDYYQVGSQQPPIKIKDDTIIYEIIEASTEAFYFVDGKMRRLTLSY